METDRDKSLRFAEALRRKALGYEVVEIKEIVEEDDSGKRKMKREKTTRVVPPDLEAMKMWKAFETGEGHKEGITLVTAVPRPPVQVGPERSEKQPDARTEEKNPAKPRAKRTPRKAGEDRHENRA